MKMFGSHNIKPLIALFNWTGQGLPFTKYFLADETVLWSRILLISCTVAALPISL
jgi:hypothetical protein